MAEHYPVKSTCISEVWSYAELVILTQTVMFLCISMFEVRTFLFLSAAALLGPVHFLSPDQQSGIH